MAGGTAGEGSFGGDWATDADEAGWGNPAGSGETERAETVPFFGGDCGNGTERSMDVPPARAAKT